MHPAHSHMQYCGPHTRQCSVVNYGTGTRALLVRTRLFMLAEIVLCSLRSTVKYTSKERCKFGCGRIFYVPRFLSARSTSHCIGKLTECRSWLVWWCMDDKEQSNEIYEDA